MDLIISQEFSSKVSRLVATDIVDCPIDDEVLQDISSKVDFTFRKVEKDGTLPFEDELLKSYIMMLLNIRDQT